MHYPRPASPSPEISTSRSKRIEPAPDVSVSRSVRIEPVDRQSPSPSPNDDAVQYHEEKRRSSVNNVLKALDEIDDDKFDPNDDDFGLCECFRKCRCFCGSRFYLLTLSSALFVQSMAAAGFVPATLATLETRYGFSSIQSGLWVASYDLLSLLFAIPFCYFAFDWHRPRYIGVAMLCCCAGCFLLFMPQVISSDYTPDQVGGTELCVINSISESCSTASSDSGAYTLLILGQMLLGVSSVPLFIFSVSSIDENVPGDKVSKYLGVLFAVAAVGPACGYILGGVFLESWVDGGDAPNNLTVDDTAWVGQWWLGFLTASILALVSCVPLFLYPRYLPQTAKIRRRKKILSDEMHKMMEKDSAENYTPPNPDPRTISLVKHIKAIIGNSMFRGIAFSGALQTFIVAAAGAFLPKFIETQYNLPGSTASIVTGLVVVPGAAGGMAFGGWWSSRQKYTPYQNARFCTIAAATACLLASIFFLGCDAVDITGVTTNYADGSSDLQSAACIANCGCHENQIYNPFCGSDGFNYYTPCAAGCTVEESKTLYSNCSCVAGAGTVSEGACDEGCGMLAVFLIGLLLAMFVTFLPPSPVESIVLKVVPIQHRIVALGTYASIGRAVGGIPGPIVLGALLDGTCSKKEEPCGQSSYCVVYDNEDERAVFASLGLIIGSLAFAFYLWTMFRIKKVIGEGEVGANASVRTVSIYDEMDIRPGSLQENHNPIGGCESKGSKFEKRPSVSSAIPSTPRASFHRGSVSMSDPQSVTRTDIALQPLPAFLPVVNDTDKSIEKEKEALDDE